MEPLDGFTADECDAVSGDRVSAAVTWGGRTAPADRAAVRASFTLRDAEPLRLLGGVVADGPFSHARNGAVAQCSRR